MRHVETNQEILKLAIKIDPAVADLQLEDLIERYDQQRFGQIICNYVCGDYRDRKVSQFTQQFMEKFFKINFDPFYEEPKETLERLKKEYET